MFKRPAKEFKTQVLFKSRDERDIRLYELNLNVIPRPIKAIIEFKTAAMTEITQAIPIENTSNRDLTCDHQLVVHGEKNHNWWEGMPDHNKFVVPKNSTGQYIVQFKPHWVGNLDATLTINIQATGDILEYQLKGISTQPLASQHYTY